MTLRKYMDRHVKYTVIFEHHTLCSTGSDRAHIGLHDFCAHKNHFSRYDLVCSQRCVEGLALAAKLGGIG